MSTLRRYLAVSAATYSTDAFPTTDNIEVFKIKGTHVTTVGYSELTRIQADILVKLNVGVWHAGPLFEVG